MEDCGNKRWAVASQGPRRIHGTSGLGEKWQAVGRGSGRQDPTGLARGLASQSGGES